MPSEPFVDADPAVIAGLDYWRTLPIKQQPEWPDPDAVGEALAKNVDLTGEDEGRQRRDLGASGGDSRGIRPFGLLLDRQLAPIVQTGDHGGISEDYGLGRVDHREVS